MPEEQKMPEEQGVIKGRSVLDLSHFTSAEQLAAIQRLEGIEVVVVPESLSAAYTAIPAKGVESTVYVPDGTNVNVRIHTGVMTVGGDGLGGADDLLVVTGLLIITSQVSGTVPRKIHIKGALYAPRGSEDALGPALADTTGAVTYYETAGAPRDVKVLSGQVKLSEALLANESGDPNDILIAAGQVTVTGHPQRIGFQRVIAAGVIVAPAAQRDVIEPKLEVTGQTSWYEGDDPRAFFDDTELGPDFFRLLDHKVSLVTFGDITLTEGVTEQMLLDKVSSIALFGDAIVPPGLIGAVQVLATDAFGAIRASDGPGD